MNEKEKKERVQLIADTLQMLLEQIDVFTMNFTKEDLEILEESKEELEERILHNNSALPLIYALGGSYDSAEDEMKIESLEGLINIIKARNEYKDKIMKIKEEQTKNKEILKLMGL